MSRDATAAFLAAISAQVVRPVLIVECVFGAAPVRLWSGMGDLAWNGQTWTGAGTLLGISTVEEPVGVVASGFTLSLSGVPLDLVAAVISDVMTGDAARIWLGLIDGAGALIASPVPLAFGRMDQPEISEDGETCEISISYESRLIDLLRPREWRYTHESQQQIFPGDRGFEYVAALQDREILWGAASPVGAAISPVTAASAAPQAAAKPWTGSNGTPVQRVAPPSIYRDASGRWTGNPDT